MRWTNLEIIDVGLDLDTGDHPNLKDQKVLGFSV
jgi:hypothetical protein